MSCAGLRALLLGEDRQIAALMGLWGLNTVANWPKILLTHSGVPPKHPIFLIRPWPDSSAMLYVKLDHTFEDVATPSHPGADTIND